MTAKTGYVYDKATGKIKYTVENVNPNLIENFRENTTSGCFIGDVGYNISGTYVKLDEKTKEPIEVSQIEHMDFLRLNKHEILSDGKDEAVISGLRIGTNVDVNHEWGYVVTEETGDSLEISCNNYSYIPENNLISVYFKSYGCHDSQIKIKVVEG